MDWFLARAHPEERVKLLQDFRRPDGRGNGGRAPQIETRARGLTRSADLAGATFSILFLPDMRALSHQDEKGHSSPLPLLFSRQHFRFRQDSCADAVNGTRFTAQTGTWRNKYSKIMRAHIPTGRQKIRSGGEVQMIINSCQKKGPASHFWHTIPSNALKDFEIRL